MLQKNKSVLVLMITTSLWLRSSSFVSRLGIHRRGSDPSHQQIFSSLFSSIAPDTSIIGEDNNVKDVLNNGNRYDVMIRRNRQSMEFRNGSPLIFSGAIESSLSYLVTTSTGKSEAGIPFGALVGVYINGSQDQNSSSNQGSNKRNGKKGGKFNSKSRNAAKDSYEHLNVNMNQDDEKTNEITSTLRQSKLIGYGVYNPHSMYRVRMICHHSSHPTLFRKVSATLKEENNNENYDDNNNVRAMKSILETKIRDAVKTRLSGLRLPSDSTDTYRLINGEGDGLSGLAVDVFAGRVAVVMSSASWCEIYKEFIIDTLKQILHSDQSLYAPSNNGDDDHTEGIEIVWRNTPSRLNQDGYPEQKQAENSMIDEEEENKCVIIKENNVLYKTYPYASSNSQKTGFYCDQRDNRFNVAKLCNDKRVLDLCCYNGGFALNAMIHGNASFCTGVDSSPVAIQAAIKNAQLNGIIDDIIPSDDENVEQPITSDEEDTAKMKFVQDDIAKFMKRSIDKGEQYDVIVLDPPKLAPNVAGLLRASKKYMALNRDAIKLINKKDGGILLTCTCSGAMTQKDGGQFFLKTVKEAALSAGRHITLLQSSGAASCHTQCPASFPAGAYLTAALFYVSPSDE